MIDGLCSYFSALCSSPLHLTIVPTPHAKICRGSPKQTFDHLSQERVHNNLHLFFQTPLDMPYNLVRLKQSFNLQSLIF